MSPDRPASLLEAALAAACEFAKRHQVDPVLTPADFGVQRSPSGLTTATYVDSSHAVTVTVDRHGETSCGVAELDWVHLEADHDRGPCDACGECPQCRSAPCECVAGRDAEGNIRLDDGRGLLVVAAKFSRADVRVWRDLCSDGDPHAARYDAALALFDREAAQS